MDVADFKARAITRKSAWPKRRQAAFMGELCERIDLVHELRQLAAAKEIADDRRERLWIDKLLRHHRLNALIKQGHAFLDETFRARQTDAALVGKQFANCADATATEMVNVVERTFAFFEAQKIFRRGDQIILGQNARSFLVLEVELLVDLVTADAAQIVTLRVKEQTLEQRTRVRSRRWISRTQTTIYVFQGLFFIFRRVFFEAFDHDAFVHRRVHHLDFCHAKFGDLFDDRLRQRLKCARHD